MKYAIVGHHSRREYANKLAAYLGAELFIDEGSHGSTWNHRRAIEWANEQEERVIILEDDVIPTVDFQIEAEKLCNLYPGHLVSFYLGTSRPPQWQKIVSNKISESDKVGHRTIVLPYLIHGVCYSIPKSRIPDILKNMDMHIAADFSVGKAYNDNVVYTIYSLVEHQDGISCEKHYDNVIRTEPRVARRLQGPLVWEK